MVVRVTNFDERHCHKWAFLLLQRQQKLNRLVSSILAQDFVKANRLFQEIFFGVARGETAEPGLAGSLLYHMAMVTKMETETSVLLKEMGIEAPDITAQLWRFYDDFSSDAAQLASPVQVSINVRDVALRSVSSCDIVA